MSKQILDVRTTYPKKRTSTIYTRALREIKYLMIHHTGCEKLTVAALYNSHTNVDHKWPTVGYHFYVTKSGFIYQMNNIDDIVNGCTDFNRPTIHVCFEGNYENEQAPKDFALVIDCILTKLAISKIFPAIKYHKEKKKTLCPGTNLVNAIIEYRLGKELRNHLIWPEI